MAVEDQRQSTPESDELLLSGTADAVEATERRRPWEATDPVLHLVRARGGDGGEVVGGGEGRWKGAGFSSPSLALELALGVGSDRSIPLVNVFVRSWDLPDQTFGRY